MYAAQLCFSFLSDITIPQLTLWRKPEPSVGEKKKKSDKI